MKKSWLIALLCIIGLYSCAPRNRGEWVIKNLTCDTVLTAKTNIKSCNRLILEVTSDFNDSFKINSIVLHGILKKETIVYDWYNSEINVPVEKYKSTKGGVQIKYYLPGNSFF